MRKPPVSFPPDEWGPWTAAYFRTQEDRDRFVRCIASTEGEGRGAESVVDNGRRALVRWRPGQFLGLNDIAYAHGGRIVLGPGHHSIL